MAHFAKIGLNNIVTEVLVVANRETMDSTGVEHESIGVEFLKTKVDTTLQFYSALSDTMHVCRPKIGDGTLLTSIWDLNALHVDLFFYQ